MIMRVVTYCAGSSLLISIRFSSFIVTALLIYCVALFLIGDYELVDELIF